MTMESPLQHIDSLTDPQRLTSIDPTAFLAERRKEVKISYSQTRKFVLDSKALADHRVVGGFKSEEINAAYKVLRTRLLQKLKANKWSAFGVTCARRGEGATLSAVNLAISLAQEHTHSVLLVDFNFHRPAVCKTLGLVVPYGIQDFLFNDVSLDKILINPGLDKLVVLPCRKPIDDASELMSTPRITELVEELKSRYPNRIVIFDLPPVLEGDDVISFSPFIDALLLVIKENTTRKEDIGMMSDLLKGIPVLGTVLNQGSR